MTRWRDRQKSPGCGLGLGDGILRHQFHLPGQAHGRRKRLRVLNLHGEAQRGQETSREELDVLRLVESPRARQKALEAVLVFRHRARAPAIRQLEQWS